MAYDLSRISLIEKAASFMTHKKSNQRPVIFKNSPISKDKDDLFGFDMQAEAIKEAINENAHIIGIIGDYGAGKSSLTEKLKHKLEKWKFKKTITINLWDSLFDQNQNGGNTKPVTISTKSFLYQLAFGNNKRNRNFAKYINHRLSKNYGKLSLSVSTYSSLVYIFISGLIFSIYIYLKDFFKPSQIKLLLIQTPFGNNEKSIDSILDIVSLIANLSPFLLFLCALLLFIGVLRGNFIFSLWDSQGKVDPDSADVFEVYREIADRLLHVEWLKLKQVIFIEDLDRIRDPETTTYFLKELYRFVNLLPAKKKDHIIYIVSLKSEEALEPGISELIYSKVFDYTVNIKPIHNENINDLVLTILHDNKDLLNIEIFSADSLEYVRKNYLKDLQWIAKGENLTIREIKDRLNDTFILYHSLKEKQDDADVQLRKCAAVVYLQRSYQHDWMVLLKNENKLVKIVQSSYLLFDKIKIADNIKSIIPLSKSENMELANKDTYFESEIFVSIFAEMLVKRDIEDDFLMYFYNYPKNSYIMDISERLIVNYLLHSEDSPFAEEERIAIDQAYIKTLNKPKKDYAIIKALSDLFEFDLPFPNVLLEFQFLFNAACKAPYVHKLVDCLSKSIKIVNSDINKDCILLRRVINYNVIEKLARDNIFRIFATSLVKILSSLGKETSTFRKLIMLSAENSEKLFSDLFLTEEMPLISIDEIKEISNKDIVLEFIEPSKITEQNFKITFNEILAFNLNATQSDKLETILSTISENKNISSFPFIALNYLIYFAKVNHAYLERIIDGIKNQAIEQSHFYKYLELVDLNKLSEDELSKIDSLNFECIVDTRILTYLEDKQLIKSSLISRQVNNELQSFNYEYPWIIQKVNEVAESICKYNENIFIDIRKSLLLNLKNEKDRLNPIYLGEFPLITQDEIEIAFVIPNGVYYFLDHEKINAENYQFIPLSINTAKLTDDTLFSVLRNLFDPNNEIGNYISDISIQRNILGQIDFKLAKLSNISNDKANFLCSFFASAFDINTPSGAIEFMHTINLLIPKLEETLFQAISDDESLFSKYIESINEIKEISDTTLSILSGIPITTPLVEEVTNILFEKGIFVPFIAGTVLRENTFTDIDQVPLDDKFTVFKQSPKCAAIMANNQDFLEKIVASELVYDANLPTERLAYFYDIQQPMKLVYFILGRLSNLEDKRNYLSKSGPFASKDDSDKFSTFITEKENVEIFRNDESFYWKMWHKLWLATDKRIFTRKINSQLGVKFRKPE
jgi:GTPase SAR1 family protein